MLLEDKSSSKDPPKTINLFRNGFELCEKKNKTFNTFQVFAFKRITILNVYV